MKVWEEKKDDAIWLVQQNLKENSRDFVVFAVSDSTVVRSSKSEVVLFLLKINSKNYLPKININLKLREESEILSQSMRVLYKYQN